jgi:hypothetical protein
MSVFLKPVLAICKTGSTVGTYAAIENTDPRIRIASADINKVRQIWGFGGGD